MAEASGDLPIIDVPVEIGNVNSYPTTPRGLDGLPIADDDMVFRDLPSYQVSDVGYVEYSLSAGTSETNSISQTTTVGAPPPLPRPQR